MKNDAWSGRVAVCIGTLGEAFRQPVTELTIRAYQVGLAGIPIQRVEEATTRAIRELRYFPPASELRHLAGELSPEERAARAWQVFRQTFEEQNYYPTIQFDDPILTATVRNLWDTWAAIEDRWTTQDEHWWRKQFEGVYCRLWASGITAHDARPLAGFHALEDARLGWDRNRLQRLGVDRPPKLITTGLPALPAHKVPRLPAQRNQSAGALVPADICKVP